MKKLLVLFLFAGAVLVVFYRVNMLRVTNVNTKTVPETVVELVCDNGYGMTARYSEPDKGGIMTRLLLTVFKDGDTRIYDMAPSMSGSGSRFATGDGKYSLWEHQGEFTFAVDEANEAVCRKKQGE